MTAGTEVPKPMPWTTIKLTPAFLSLLQNLSMISVGPKTPPASALQKNPASNSMHSAPMPPAVRFSLVQRAPLPPSPDRSTHPTISPCSKVPQPTVRPEPIWSTLLRTFHPYVHSAPQPRRRRKSRHCSIRNRRWSLSARSSALHHPRNPDSASLLHRSPTRRQIVKKNSTFDF